MSWVAEVLLGDIWPRDRSERVRCEHDFGWERGGSQSPTSALGYSTEYARCAYTLKEKSQNQR